MASECEITYMKCTSCNRDLSCIVRSDRGSGQVIDLYKCLYCGMEFREYRTNRQTIRF